MLSALLIGLVLSSSRLDPHSDRLPSIKRSRTGSVPHASKTGKRGHVATVEHTLLDARTAPISFASQRVLMTMAHDSDFIHKYLVQGWWWCMSYNLESEIFLHTSPHMSLLFAPADTILLEPFSDNTGPHLLTTVGNNFFNLLTHEKVLPMFKMSNAREKSDWGAVPERWGDWWAFEANKEDATLGYERLEAAKAARKAVTDAKSVGKPETEIATLQAAFEKASRVYQDFVLGVMVQFCDVEQTHKVNKFVPVDRRSDEDGYDQSDWEDYTEDEDNGTVVRHNVSRSDSYVGGDVDESLIGSGVLLGTSEVDQDYEDASLLEHLAEITTSFDDLKQVYDVPIPQEDEEPVVMFQYLAVFSPQVLGDERGGEEIEGALARSLKKVFWGFWKEPLDWFAYHDWNHGAAFATTLYELLGADQLPVELTNLHGEALSEQQSQTATTELGADTTRTLAMLAGLYHDVGYALIHHIKQNIPDLWTTMNPVTNPARRGFPYAWDHELYSLLAIVLTQRAVTQARDLKFESIVSPIILKTKIDGIAALSEDNVRNFMAFLNGAEAPAGDYVYAFSKPLSLCLKTFWTETRIPLSRSRSGCAVAAALEAWMLQARKDGNPALALIGA